MSAADDRVWAVTLELAKHHRIDPIGRDERCSCGFKTRLGKFYSEHIARIIDSIYTGGRP